MSHDIVVPIALDKTNTCTITPEWFVNNAEYYLLPGKFKLLTNGEETFGAVYDAIAGAQKSVSIICWGFQPSMYFKRRVTGYGLRIGELLEARAIAGVKVRVLSWALEVDIGIARVSVEGLAEANLTGRRAFSVNDCPPTMRPDAFKYSKEWFMRYDKGQGFVDKHLRSGDGKAKTENIEFVSRGFSAGDRVGIATSDRED